MLYTDSMETETKPHLKRPAKQSATVRISEQSHQHLRELAAQSGEPMQAVLDKEAWEDLQKEYKSFEGTLMDGLDPHEDWSHLRAPQLQEAQPQEVEEAVA